MSPERESSPTEPTEGVLGKSRSHAQEIDEEARSVDPGVRAWWEERRSLARRTAVVTAVAVGIILLAFLAWEVAKVLLLAFAGMLFGTLLRAGACWVRDHTGMSYKQGFAVALIGFILLLVGGAMLLAPRIDEQAGELATQLPTALERLDREMSQYGWYRWLSGVTGTPQEMVDKATESAGSSGGDGAGGPSGEEEGSGGGTLFQGALGWASVGVGAFVNLVVILFVGLYLAAQPDLYRRGILRLVPLSRRDAAAHVLDSVDHTIKHWLMGQLIAMTIVGVATAVGLMLLGVPLALGFGILAALLTFIPNFGPILSAIPPTLLAMAESPRLGLWVILLYLGVQTVESYFITPMIQQKAVDLPPALILLSQILLGILFGFLGLAVATPLTAVVLVLVQTLYVERALHDDLDEPPEGSYLAALKES